MKRWHTMLEFDSSNIHDKQSKMNETLEYYTERGWTLEHVAESMSSSPTGRVIHSSFFWSKEG